MIFGKRGNSGKKTVMREEAFVGDSGMFFSMVKRIESKRGKGMGCWVFFFKEISCVHSGEWKEGGEGDRGFCRGSDFYISSL